MSTIQRSATDTAGFIPQYWAQKALDVLRQNIVLAQVVATASDFGETAFVGKSITVPYPGVFTPVNKVEGTVVTPQTPVGGSSVTLTLDKHKIVGFSVEDFTQAVANGSLEDRYFNPAVISLAEQFESDLWQAAVMAAPTVTPLGTSGTDLTAAITRSAMATLNTNKAPRSQRSLVISPKDEAALLGDSNLATYFAFSQADAIRNGYFGRLYGFDAYMSQAAPSGSATGTAWKATTTSDSTFTIGGQTTASWDYDGTGAAAALQVLLAGLSSVGSGNVTVSGPDSGPYHITFFNGVTGALTASTATIALETRCVALHRNALLYACRPFADAPPGSGVSTAQANDPESGISIRVSAQYDINAVAMRVNFDLLYGITVLRTNQAVQMIT